MDIQMVKNDWKASIFLFLIVAYELMLSSLMGSSIDPWEPRRGDNINLIEKRYDAPLFSTANHCKSVYT